METLLNLFGRLIGFTYHCFDRIVINGYLLALMRPENVVYYFRNVFKEPCITKEVLLSPTRAYQKHVETFAARHHISINWAQKDVRKKDHLQEQRQIMERTGRYGVYAILKAMEVGPTFRSVKPRYPTDDPNYRILQRCLSRYTHYYFYVRDEQLGALAIRIGSFLPFQSTCFLNGHELLEQALLAKSVGYRKKDNAFLAVDDPGVLQELANQLNPATIQARLEHWIALLGPQFSLQAQKTYNLRRSYFMAQVEYCLNLIFHQNFPIRRLFERSCELGLLTLSADKISRIFGWRLNRNLKGKLQAVLERMSQGHHVLRAYFKNSFVKQYEKFRTLLRLELCSNNLDDLRIRKSLKNLGQVRENGLKVLDRFALVQSPALNAHFDFPLLQKLALPITVKSTRMPGIKIQDTRILRLMEVIMHAGTTIRGWTTTKIHQAIVENFGLTDYTINQVRYDLRKMMAHGLIERDGSHYAYHLTDKGRKVAVMFVLFHQRLGGPLAGSLFNHRPNPRVVINRKLEKAYHRADEDIQKIIEILAA